MEQAIEGGNHSRKIEEHAIEGGGHTRAEQAMVQMSTHSAWMRQTRKGTR